MNLSVAPGTVGMQTALNVTAKRYFRGCLTSFTIVAVSAQTEDHWDTTPLKWSVSGPISESGSIQYKDTNHWSAKFSAPLKRWTRERTHSNTHGAKQYLFATLFFWRTVCGKRAPIIHWRAKNGRDWTRWQKYSKPNRTPVVRTVITLTEKNIYILYIEKKTRGSWALLTDTKTNQFRIITVILVVNEASNWQNWITLRQWSKNASFYRINCSDSLFSLLFPWHSSNKIYLSSIRKWRFKIHWVQMHSVCERKASVPKETRIKQFNTYCTWSHTQSTISGKKKTLVRYIRHYQVGMKRRLLPCGTWPHVVW